MTGGFTSRDPLPPFSLTDPLPTTGGCTIESIYGPNFGINEIYLDNLKNTTDDPQSVNFRFHLRKYHTGQDDVIENTINISRISNSSVAQTWVTSDFLTSGTYKCAWKYDFARNHFTFDYEWLCNDKDAVNQYVTYFSCICWRHSANGMFPTQNMVQSAGFGRFAAAELHCRRPYRLKRLFVLPVRTSRVYRVLPGYCFTWKSDIWRKLDGDIMDSAVRDWKSKKHRKRGREKATLIPCCGKSTSELQLWQCLGPSS